MGGFPWWSRGKDSTLPLQWVQVRSLVGELRFYMLHSTEKITKILTATKSGQCKHVARMLSRFNRVWLLATLQTIAHQAPLSMGFSRHEYESGLPCPPPGELPDQEGRFFTLAPPGKPLKTCYNFLSLLLSFCYFVYLKFPIKEKRLVLSFSKYKIRLQYWVRPSREKLCPGGWRRGKIRSSCSHAGPTALVVWELYEVVEKSFLGGDIQRDPLGRRRRRRKGRTTDSLVQSQLVWAEPAKLSWALSVKYTLDFEDSVFF